MTWILQSGARPKDAHAPKTVAAQTSKKIFRMIYYKKYFRGKARDFYHIIMKWEKYFC